jgi:hypothetical protein
VKAEQAKKKGGKGLCKLSVVMSPTSYYLHPTSAPSRPLYFVLCVRCVLSDRLTAHHMTVSPPSLSPSTLYGILAQLAIPFYVCHRCVSACAVSITERAATVFNCVESLVKCE